MLNTGLNTQESFVSDEVIENLDKMTRLQADQLPFGVSQVDDEGNIIMYNKYNREEFIKLDEAPEGKNFFGEIAPCANNFMFKGRFSRGVQNDNLDTEFDYVFTYKMMPTKVRVRMYREPNSQTNWIFVIKKGEK